MKRNIILLLVLTIICTTVLQAQQKITAAGITGKWLITAFVQDGNIIPLSPKENLEKTLLDMMVKKKRARGITPNRLDTTDVLLQALTLMEIGTAMLTFTADKSFVLTGKITGAAKKGGGVWRYSVKEQTFFLTEYRDGKKITGLFSKIQVKENMLLAVLGTYPNHLFLLTKNN